MHIPESCKWSSKKRSRKTFEQQQNRKHIDDDDDGETNDTEFRLSSQKDEKQQPEVVLKVSQSQSDSETIKIQDHNKININDYFPKKLKTTSVNDQSEQCNQQKIELQNIPLVKSEQKPTATTAKSQDLIYTNKLLEIKKRIWSDDLTQDETEKIIRDFEAFRRANRPEILSKQSKDSLRETDARFAYLIDKWDIDINSLLNFNTQA